MNTVQDLPGTFPLHADKKFLAESEWVIFKLLCRPIDSLPHNNPEELSQATGKQVTPERCDELIRIVQINQLSGLGSWIARLLAEAGMNAAAVRNNEPASIMQAVNDKAAYAICNEASIHALANLQKQWKGEIF
ncbi:MAG: hypothetical protein Q9M20_07350 [Mariprofundaceae bacterium]|nr:hypothetical protein [Mariprofundaceae bacterium]